jgi:hypothetical protein
MPSAPKRYERHRPETTVLYGLVQGHLESFLLHVRESTERRLPRYVEQEFRRYVQCGILSCGFARAACSCCGHELLLALSCKVRGVCPSCSARRACESAAHLIDHVLPDVPLRQWVLSVPFEMRLLLAAKPDALSAVGRIFVQEISRWQRSSARLDDPGRRPKGGTLRTGAICFPQRFGGSLNLNVHFHVIVPDALFALGADGSPAVRLEHGPPTSLDLAEIVQCTKSRVLAWLERKGYLRNDGEEDGEPRAEQQDSALSACLAGSLGVGQLHPLPGRPRRSTEAPDRPKPQKGFTAESDGFNVHAGVRVAAGATESRERLLRYCARSPLSLERLSLLDDGRVSYRVQHGEAVRIMTPMQFMARLAALIPPPRHPLIRFHGVFAPHSKARARVVPARVHDPCEPDCGHGRVPGEAATSDPRSESVAAELAVQAPSADHTGISDHRSAEPPPASVRSHDDEAVQLATERPPSRVDWATLLKRVYGIDALECPRCGGRLRFTAVYEDEAVAQAELERRGLPHAPPALARARAPDEPE